MAHLIDKPVAPHTSSDVALSARIQALPQELQDVILWSLDGFGIPSIVHITKAYPVPYTGPIYTQKRFTDDSELPIEGHLTIFRNSFGKFAVHRRNINLYRKCYTPPLALQLDRKLRKQFARKYYSSAIFECVTGRLDDLLWHRRGPISGQMLGKHQEASRHFLSWLRSLSNTHRAMIRNLQISGVDERADYDHVRGQEIITDAKLMHESLLSTGSGYLNQTRFIFCYKSLEEERMRKFDVNGDHLLDQ